MGGLFLLDLDLLLPYFRSLPFHFVQEAHVIYYLNSTKNLRLCKVVQGELIHVNLLFFNVTI